MDSFPFHIRSMHINEKDRVLAVMKLSFPPVQRLFFSLTKNVLVAQKENDLLGAIVLKKFDLNNSKIGLVYWIFTAPTARGLGVGGQLIKKGLETLEEMGCQEVFACIEGHNTSSSNLLSGKGFEILTLGQQVKRFGLDLIPFWLKIFHIIDFGHFLWVKPAVKEVARPGLRWWGNAFFNGLIAYIASIRLLKFQTISLEIFFQSFIAVFVLFGIRNISMGLTAYFLKMKVRFRLWESAFPLSLLISLAVGRWMPIPGSMYPVSSKWSYKNKQSELGKMSLISCTMILILAFSTQGLISYDLLPSHFISFAKTLITFSKPLLIFDIVLIFFPFTCFNGARLWDWNKMVWALYVILSIYFYLKF
ncbi:MAG TPA: GNAT family N-acetyltransferase [Sulfurimonas sp.]|nr:GNAT family N-acetyltransferase [Sulfurimonas sp.]